MKRTTRHHKLSSQLVSTRALRLAKETVKVLTSDELSQAGGGGESCPTDSMTTRVLAPGKG
jgi:hypothetical protein